VPCGFVDGLPVALSLTGRPGEDAVTLTAAEQLQQRFVPGAPALYTKLVSSDERG
jgi:Asp-tRNA(Asn)/Glu-tRNA(Gln) amidotransferase A subunit family amidase